MLSSVFGDQRGSTVKTSPSAGQMASTPNCDLIRSRNAHRGLSSPWVRTIRGIAGCLQVTPRPFDQPGLTRVGRKPPESVNRGLDRDRLAVDPDVPRAADKLGPERPARLEADEDHLDVRPPEVVLQAEEMGANSPTPPPGVIFKISEHPHLDLAEPAPVFY